MTVRQNILCGLRWEKNKQAREEELQRVLALLRLEGLEKHRPYQLSGGQAQRVALGRILVNRPRLLMPDGTFSALDSHLRDKLQLELQELLAGFGRPVLLVTHSRDEAYHLCHRIAVLDEGHLLTLQEKKELFANPGSIRAASLTGCKNIAPARKTGEYEVEVPDWGIRLITAQRVREDVKAVGIRAHYFNAKSAQNWLLWSTCGRWKSPLNGLWSSGGAHKSPALRRCGGGSPRTAAPPAFRKPLALRPPMCCCCFTNKNQKTGEYSFGLCPPVLFLLSIFTAGFPSP